jgi:hypothetical protein
LCPALEEERRRDFLSAFMITKSRLDYLTLSRQLMPDQATFSLQFTYEGGIIVDCGM